MIGTIAYENLGRRTSLTLGNGVATHYQYDPVSRLGELRLDFAGTADDLTSEFAYNPASQIASTLRSNDAYAWAGHGSGTISTTSNGRNQIAGWVSTLGHDAKGNITADGPYSYTYSSENLLTSLANPTPGAIQSSSTYAYDPLMRLAVINSSNDALDSNLGYDGADFILEVLSASRTRRYVRGPGVDEALVAYLVTPTGTSRLWYQADERGSIVRLSNDSGTPGGIGKYDEYGVGGTGRIRYAGQYWLADGNLIYSRARIYDPTLGRFLQTDPIGYGDGMNMYGYVGGDPVNSSDPTGTDMENALSSNRAYPIDNDDEWYLGKGINLIALAGGHSRDGMGMSDLVRMAGGRHEAVAFERWQAADMRLNAISAGTGISKSCLLSAICTSGSVYLAAAKGSNDWTDNDFLGHYFGGNGEAVSLSQIGLDDAYLSHPSVKSLTGAYMIALSNLPIPYFWSPQTEIGHTDVTNTIYSVGRSALYAAGGCQGADCFFRFTVRDQFRDPVHLGVEIPFGVPYDIRYEWSVQRRRRAQ